MHKRPILSNISVLGKKTLTHFFFSFDLEYRIACFIFLATNHTFNGGCISFLLVVSLLHTEFSLFFTLKPSSFPQGSIILCSSCALVSASCFLVYSSFRFPLNLHKKQNFQSFVNPLLPILAVQPHDKLRNHTGSLCQRILLRFELASKLKSRLGMLHCC